MFEDPLEKEEEKTVPHHINDSEARDLLRKLCSDSNICAIQTFQRKERNSILESALRRGLGVRQLARLTGVSYGIIQRINEKVGQRCPLTHAFSCEQINTCKHPSNTHKQIRILTPRITLVRKYICKRPEKKATTRRTPSDGGHSLSDSSTTLIRSYFFIT